MRRSAATGSDAFTLAAPKRTMRSRPATLATLLCVGVLLAPGAGVIRSAGAKPSPTIQAARIDPAQFQTTVDNPYHPLIPGTTFKYVEKLGRNVSDIEIAVTHETKVVMGVTCTVVREKVWEKGKLTQESLSWYAQDAKGSVWAFGEDAKEFLERGRVSTEGSWQAGADGAEPGVVMPGAAVPGEPYRQGYLAGVAEDMAQIVAVGDSVTVPFGSFGTCLKTKEWSMLESGTDKKWYACGVGLVRALSAAREDLVLVSVTHP